MQRLILNFIMVLKKRYRMLPMLIQTESQNILISRRHILQALMKVNRIFVILCVTIWR